MWGFWSFKYLDFQEKGIWIDSQYLDFSFKNNWFLIYQTFYTKRSDNLKFNFKVFKKWKFIQDINVTYYFEDVKDAFILAKVVIKQFLSSIFDIESELDLRYKIFQKEPDESILIIPREIIIHWDKYCEGEDKIYCNNVCIYERETLNLLYKRKKSYTIKSFNNPLFKDYSNQFYYFFENEETKYFEIFSKEGFEEILMCDNTQDLSKDILEAAKKENNNPTFWLLINTWIYWIARLQRFKCASSLRDIIETIKRHSIKSNLWFDEFLSFMLKKGWFEFRVNNESDLFPVYDNYLTISIKIENYQHIENDNDKLIKNDNYVKLENELYELGWKRNLTSWNRYHFYLKEDWSIEKPINWNRKIFHRFADNFFRVGNYVEPATCSLVYKIGNEEPKLVFKYFDEFNFINKKVTHNSNIHTGIIKLFYTKNQEYIFYIWTKVYFISKEWDKIYELKLTDYFWNNKTDEANKYVLFLERENNRLFIHKQKKSILVLDINTRKVSYINLDGKEIYVKKGTKFEWEVCLRNYSDFENFYFSINNYLLEKKIRNVELLNLIDQIYIDRLFNLSTDEDKRLNWGTSSKDKKYFSTKLWIKWYYYTFLYKDGFCYDNFEMVTLFTNNNLFLNERNYIYWTKRILWDITRNYHQLHKSNKIMLQNNYKLHVLMPNNKLFFSNRKESSHFLN